MDILTEKGRIGTGGERVLSSRDHRILRLLSKREYTTAASLAEELEIGVKTVRTRIKEMNPEIRKSGVEILSKPRYGYYIVSSTPGGLERLLEENGGEEKKIPETGAERVNYLLAYLLNQKRICESGKFVRIFVYFQRNFDGGAAGSGKNLSAVWSCVGKETGIWNESDRNGISDPAVHDRTFCEA